MYKKKKTWAAEAAQVLSPRRDETSRSTGVLVDEVDELILEKRDESARDVVEPDLRQIEEANGLLIVAAGHGVHRSDLVDPRDDDVDLEGCVDHEAQAREYCGHLVADILGIVAEPLDQQVLVAHVVERDGIGEAAGRIQTAHLPHDASVRGIREDILEARSVGTRGTLILGQGRRGDEGDEGDGDSQRTNFHWLASRAASTPKIGAEWTSMIAHIITNVKYLSPIFLRFYFVF